MTPAYTNFTGGGWSSSYNMAGGKRKQTDAVVKSRIAQVYKLLLLGASRARIIQFAANPGTEASPKPGWDVSDRTIDEYIRRATEMIAEQAEAIKANAFEDTLVKLSELYYSNMLIKDYKAANGVLKTRAELLGLNAPKRQDITSGGQPLAAPVVYLPEIKSDDEG